MRLRFGLDVDVDVAVGVARSSRAARTGAGGSRRWCVVPASPTGRARRAGHGSCRRRGCVIQRRGLCWGSWSWWRGAASEMGVVFRMAGAAVLVVAAASGAWRGDAAPNGATAWCDSSLSGGRGRRPGDMRPVRGADADDVCDVQVAVMRRERQGRARWCCGAGAENAGEATGKARGARGGGVAGECRVADRPVRRVGVTAPACPTARANVRVALGWGCLCRRR
jgi:hypothetical protein